MHKLLWFLPCFGWATLTTAAKAKSDRAILLSNVKILTLYADKKTSHRRVSAIPQLKCVGGNGCKVYNVDVMRCQNAGAEYGDEDIQWTCSASLPPEVKLGSTEVVCEGYDNADDPYVLKGSCGVEYRLLLTDEGERLYPGKSKQHPARDHYTGHDDSSEGTANPIAKFLFWLVFVGILCLILYRIFNPTNDGQIRLGGNNRPGWGGGGGGGGDNGFDDPPPPYSPQAPRAKPSYSRGSSSRNSGPGFWTGAATGGAAGYGAGYYQATRNAERQRERERSSSSWFGSGSGAGPSSSGGGSGFGGGSSSPSSSRHDSTGFGGTRRR